MMNVWRADFAQPKLLEIDEPVNHHIESAGQVRFLQGTFHPYETMAIRQEVLVALAISPLSEERKNVDRARR